MSNKTLFFVLAVVFLLFFLAKFKSEQFGHQDKPVNAQLVQFDMESVNRLSLSHGEQEHIFIKNRDNVWHVQTVYNYAADRSRLGKLLLQLHDIQSSQEITSNPENYSRLGLDIDGRTRILLQKDGETLAGIDFGEGRGEGSDSPDSGGGRYVRPHTGDTVYLIKEDFDIASKPSDWLQTDIVHVPKESITEIQLLETKPSLSIISNPDSEGSFLLTHLKEGDQAKSWMPDQMASCLENLTFTELFPVDDPAMKGKEFLPMVKILTQDALEYIVSVNHETPKEEESEENWYLTLSVTSSKPSLDEPSEKVLSLQQDLAPWIFKVDNWTGSKFQKSYDDMVEAPPAEQDDTGKTSAFDSAKSEMNLVPGMAITDTASEGSHSSEVVAAVDVTASNPEKPSVEDSIHVSN